MVGTVGASIRFQILQRSAWSQRLVSSHHMCHALGTSGLRTCERARPPARGRSPIVQTSAAPGQPHSGDVYSTVRRFFPDQRGPTL